MTDWIEHAGGTCPVDPETVVFVRYGSGLAERGRANGFPWWMRNPAGITHYRIITPAKPPEPEEDEAYLEEAQRQADREYSAYKRGVADGRAHPEPDFVNLRLECLKLAASPQVSGVYGLTDLEQVADRFLRYAIDGWVDKA